VSSTTAPTVGGTPPTPTAARPGPGPMERRLREARAGGRKLLVPYLTGGLGPWTDLVRAAADAGADAVEVGIPFSDPAMDGPVIQQASEQALRSGTTPGSIFADLRGVDAGVPLVAMTYYNLPFHMGEERFAGEMAEAGFSGMVLPDVPMEEQGPWRAAADAAGVETVLLAGPITPDDRLRAVCDQTRGYVYGVNLMGITGERASIGEQAAVLAGRLKAATDKPVLMGFGVSTPDQAAEVAATSDGVIVGTAVVRRVLEGATPEDLHAYVSTLRVALDAA
jgi:tryptophan synthase alpha chain